MGKKTAELKEEKGHSKKRSKAAKSATESTFAESGEIEEQPKRKSKKTAKALAAAESGVAVTEGELQAPAFTEGVEDPEGEDAAQKKQQKSRKHPAISATPQRDEDHVIDVQGNRIPIPPKHGSPISHTRPKRPPVAGPVAYDNVMEIRIHTRKFQDDPSSTDDALPSASIHVPPSTTLEGLRQKIHQYCPSLPPRAQHFFRRLEGTDQFQRLDTSSRYNKSLRAVGYDLPGPHDIWVEIDLSELLNAPLEPQTQMPVAEGQAMQAAPPQLQQNQLALVAANPEAHQGEQVQDPTMVSGLYDPTTGQELVLPEAAPLHHRSFNKRNRSNKRWTEEEIENLILGLMKYGTSSWTTIAKTWRFDDRTTVDLKDKWRNLVKNVRDGRQMRGMTLTEEAKNRVWRIIHENGIDPSPQNQLVHVQVQQPLQLQQAIQDPQAMQDPQTLQGQPLQDQQALQGQAQALQEQQQLQNEQQMHVQQQLQNQQMQQEQVETQDGSLTNM